MVEDGAEVKRRFYDPQIMALREDLIGLLRTFQKVRQYNQAEFSEYVGIQQSEASNILASKRGYSIERLIHLTRKCYPQLAIVVATS